MTLRPRNKQELMDWYVAQSKDSYVRSKEQEVKSLRNERDMLRAMLLEREAYTARLEHDYKNEQQKTELLKALRAKDAAENAQLKARVTELEKEREDAAKV